MSVICQFTNFATSQLRTSNLELRRNFAKIKTSHFGILSLKNFALRGFVTSQTSNFGVFHFTSNFQNPTYNNSSNTINLLKLAMTEDLHYLVLYDI